MFCEFNKQVQSLQKLLSFAMLLICQVYNKDMAQGARYAISIFHQRITFGAVADTNGPITVKCSSN